jgi:hypothetical protein
MIEQLHQFCPRGYFNEAWEYHQFMKILNELIIAKRLIKITPTKISKWDMGADFYQDTVSKIVYKLAHPEAPFKGEWIAITSDYPRPTK